VAKAKAATKQLLRYELLTRAISSRGGQAPRADRKARDNLKLYQGDGGAVNSIGRGSLYANGDDRMSL
jgi:hypothetical protein